MSNDTETLTLSDFLLARIAEEEASLEGEQRPPSLHHIVSLVDPTRTVAERVLAECAAKRRIVEWCGERERVWIGHFGQSPETHPDQFVPGELRNPADAMVLRFMAQPFADHPDFREEWRE